MYMNANGDAAGASLRARPVHGQHRFPQIAPAPSAPAAPSGSHTALPGAVIPPLAVASDPDASPATAPPKPKEDPTKENVNGKDDESSPASRRDSAKLGESAEQLLDSPGEGKSAVKDSTGDCRAESDEGP